MSDDRWWIVVVREPNYGLSAMAPMSYGGLTLCTEAEADAIVEAWTADPREGGTAHKVEVFHYDGCPLRPPACWEPTHTGSTDGVPG